MRASTTPGGLDRGMRFAVFVVAALGSGCANGGSASSPPTTSTAAPAPTASVTKTASSDRLRIVRAACVHYDPPRRHFRGEKAVDATRGAEIDLEIPEQTIRNDLLARAETMTLFVGEVPVADEGGPLGPTTIRFVSYSPSMIPVGGLLSLRWRDGRAPPISSSQRWNGCE